MRVIPQLSRTELGRIGAGAFGKVVLLALLLIPSIYGGLLVWSNLEVTTHLDGVPAAVVDLDRPATVTDAAGKHERIDLGRTVTDRLVDDTSPSNLDWTATSADEARRGLADGTYYAVLTIPADFSTSATSTSDADTAHKADLQLDTNDATSYLAGNIASSIGNKLQNSTGDGVAQRYLDRVYLGFNGIQAQFTKAADGADQVKGGAHKLLDGLQKADTSAPQLVLGLTQLSTGATSLSTGTTKLASGAAQLASGNGSLAAGAGTLADGLATLQRATADLPAQTAALAKGGRSLTDGSARLASGATQLAQGLTAATTAVQALPGQAQALSNGANELAVGIDTLAAGARPLAQGASDVADGGAALAAGAHKVADGAGDVALGARGVDAGATKVAQGTARAADGVHTYTKSVDALARRCAASGADATFCAELTALDARGAALDSGADAASDGAATLAAATGRLATGAGTLAQGAAPLDAGAAKLAAGAKALEAGATRFSQGTTAASAGSRELGKNLATLATKVPQLGTGLTQAQSAATQLATGATSLSAGSARLTTGLDRLAAGTPALSSGVVRAATGATSLRDGARTLSTGATKLATGAKDASAGAGTLATGADKAHAGGARLADGIHTLTRGAKDLDGGVGRLATGLRDGADKVPTYDAAARDRLTNVVASPVSADATRLHKVPSYGYGLAPYFLSLALWVGGMAAYMMLQPLSLDALRRRVAPWRVSLGGLAPGLILAVGQVAALLAIVRFAIGIEAADPWEFAALALLASLTFVAINHGLVAALGPAGRFLGLVLIVLQLSSAGATYPIEASPAFFQVAHRFLPITYSVRAFRDLIAGGDVDLTSSVLVLLAWLAFAIVLGVLGAVKTRRHLTPLRPDEQPAPQGVATAADEEQVVDADGAGKVTAADGVDEATVTEGAAPAEGSSWPVSAVVADDGADSGHGVAADPRGSYDTAARTDPAAGAAARDDRERP